MAATVPEGDLANGVATEDPEPLCSNGIGGCKPDISDLKSKTENLVNGTIANGFHDADAKEEKNETEGNSEEKSEQSSNVSETLKDSNATTTPVEAKDVKEVSDAIDKNHSRDSTPLSDISTLTPGASRSGTPVSSQEKTEDILKVDRALPQLAQEKVSRSSEERSMDSTDSGTSNKSSSSAFKTKTTPKARKSGPQAKNILPSALGIKSSSSSGENVKLNLPQFNNAITVDSKFLEKISKLSSVKHDIKHEKTHTVLPVAKDNVENGGVEQKVKKSRASLPINSQPKIKTEVPEKADDTLSDSSLLEKDAFGKVKKRSKKRRKMGAYKLPSEIKKKVFASKKKDGDSSSLKDDEDSKSSCGEKLGHMELPKSVSNSKLSSPENCSRRSAWDLMKSPRVTPKGKNTLGSTRQKLALGSDQQSKSKAQTSLDSFLNRCDQKPSQIDSQVKYIEKLKKIAI